MNVDRRGTGSEHLRQAEQLLRVERGHANDEELAAVTALLLARASVTEPAPPHPGHRSRAVWRRLERTAGYRVPRSWQG